MHKFGYAAKRAMRGFALINVQQRKDRREMAKFPADRPGDRTFSSEHIAEAEVRKAKTKAEELEWAQQKRRSCG